MFVEEVNLINQRLQEMLEDYLEIRDSMQYSLLPGGKRLRSLLVLLILKDLGIDINKGLDIACAIEMIHTYSLIHDDLPAIDNDDFRRGEPTNHIVFGEAVAILAGDALLTEAFYWLSNADVESHKLIKIINLVSRLCGARGMIRGQYLDIKIDDHHSLERIDLIHTHKTKDLIEAAVLSSCIIAGDEDPIWSEFANYFGKAFQIKDDLNDIAKEEESTIVKAIGINEANKLFLEYRIKCLNIIEQKIGKKDLYKLVEWVI